MRKQGFTLSELLVGLVIGLLLTTAMMSFTSTIVFDFHTQKDVVNDRTVLKQIMNGLSEDMVQIGYDANANGEFEIGEGTEVFLSIEDGAVGKELVYWVPTANLDDVTSARPGNDLGWQKITWSREWLMDPIFGFRVPCLVKTIEDADGVELSSEPVLTHVRTFAPEIGMNNGIFEDNPANVTYSLVNAVRVRLETSTPTNSANDAYSGLDQETTQTYFLRSRSL